MNQAIIIGRCARDPELKFIPSTGLAVTKMTIAVDREMSREKKQEAQAQGKQTADFINVTVFGKMAEASANYLARGRQCAVKGRINTGSYEKDDGTKVYTTDVIADKVEFLGNKEQQQSSENSGFTPQDEDVFTPVDDEDIPF